MCQSGGKSIAEDARQLESEAGSSAEEASRMAEAAEAASEDLRRPESDTAEFGRDHRAEEDANEDEHNVDTLHTSAVQKGGTKAIRFEVEAPLTDFFEEQQLLAQEGGADEFVTAPLEQFMIGTPKGRAHSDVDWMSFSLNVGLDSSEGRSPDPEGEASEVQARLELMISEAAASQEELLAARGEQARQMEEFLLAKASLEAELLTCRSDVDVHIRGREHAETRTMM